MTKPKTYLTNKKFQPLLMKKLWEKAGEFHQGKNPDEWRKKFQGIVERRDSKALDAVLPANFVFHCYSWTRHTGTFDENIIRIFKEAIKPELEKGTGNVSARQQLEAHMITARAGDFIADIWLKINEHTGHYTFIASEIVKRLPENPEMRRALRYITSAALRVLKNHELI